MSLKQICSRSLLSQGARTVSMKSAASSVMSVSADKAARFPRTLPTNHPTIQRCVDSEDCKIFILCLFPIREIPLAGVMENTMELVLIIVVLFLVFGGGGYWGFRRWR